MCSSLRALMRLYSAKTSKRRTGALGLKSAISNSSPQSTQRARRDSKFLGVLRVLGGESPVCKKGAIRAGWHEHAQRFGTNRDVHRGRADRLAIDLPGQARAVNFDR